MGLHSLEQCVPIIEIRAHWQGMGHARFGWPRTCVKAAGSQNDGDYSFHFRNEHSRQPFEVSLSQLSGENYEATEVVLCLTPEKSRITL